MIKITNLNKYFNKGKVNEIHVIDNTSVDFPEKGLVAITGPSGCGKTTLLNVIGGLDSFASGEISFEEHVMKKYKPLEWDILRNHYSGYIFQNYNLISDKTVYENIEVSLNMAGLYDKKEIEERINYVLEAVGMYNYRRRNVRALSGGQQQRVAIARAISKNPKVVLADEPTGNLDANNTFEIMSIIKKISQTCLVILVSHERSLVDFYADRIIEISDGKITNDYDNSGSKSIEHMDERNIYLKDLTLDESAKDNNIIRYYEKEKDDSLNFQVIEVKDSIYIKAETGSKKKIKFITEDTEIRLIDDHYKARESHEALDYSFDLETFEEIKHPENKKSFIKMKDTMKQGLGKVIGKRKFIGKLFLLVYFVISALVVYQLASFASLTKVDEEDFLHTSKNLVAVNSEEPLNQSDINNILDNVDNIEWSPYLEEQRMYIQYFDFYQGDVNEGVSAYPVKLSWIDSEDMLIGELPANNLEIVIDKWIADEILESKSFVDLGVTEYTELLGSTFRSQTWSGFAFEIVGIIETESPIMVVNDDSILAFFGEFYQAFPNSACIDRVTMVDGRGISDNSEVLMSESNKDFNIGDDVVIAGNQYEIVGVYTVNEGFGLYEDAGFYIVDDSVVEFYAKVILLEYYYYDSHIYFYSNDLGKAIQDIEDYDDEYSAFNSYEAQRAQAIENQREQVQTRITSIIITISGIIVYIFFMMRSSMLNRIKEIGIYRSIGATKRDIYKIFFGEIFWFTTIGSLSGYLIMALLISRIQNMVGDLIEFFYFPIHYFLGGIIGIYLLNFIFGILPIFSLLRKTPSEINAKFDI